VLSGESTAAVGETLSADEYADNPLAYFFVHLSRAHAAAIFGDQDGLAEHIAAAMPLVPVLPGLYSIAVAYLLRGLSLAGQARSADADRRAALLAELDDVTRWLAERAADAPDNFLHVLHLVQAERAWTADNFRGAVLAFDAAQREVAQRHRPWHRGLIAERAGRFYLAHGAEHLGYDLLAQARQEYAAWGASAKAEQLDWAYPFLRPRSDPAAGYRGGQPDDLTYPRSALTTGTIDLLGILSASRALSSETSIDRLHARVVEVLSAMTGATGVHLLQWDEDRQDWLLPAQGDGGGSAPADGAGNETTMPTSVLRYVRRIREPLMVSDATRDDRFARDPYFNDVDCCSLLAVPIVSRGAQQAVLLLENRLIRGAFTTGRLDAVKLIAGQLATSLDNAQLYGEFIRIASEQAALRRVATLVALAASPQEVFAAVAAEIGQVLGVDFTALTQFEPHDAITIVGAWSDKATTATSAVGRQLPLGGRNVTTMVHRTGQAARIDYTEASGAIGDVAARDWGWRAVAGVPIKVEGRLWGVMIAARTREESLPADTETRLTAFTELVGTAIANAQARVDLQGSADEQAALRRVAELVARSAPPQEVLAAVTDEAGRRDQPLRADRRL